MKYKLEAYTIYELGQRSNQEDSISPADGEASGDDRLFILCDGMGGHSSGEVASAAVCEGLSRTVMSICPDPEGEFSDEDFQKALSAAYDLLDTKDDGATKKMGTTMTFLKLHSEGCTIAHIGDSRVYHIRPGKDKESTEILFQTVDHSLVNDLLRNGELLPEEVKDFKQKNVITRAMQPNMDRRCKASLHHISDIRPGDCFLLCSDGILENMEEDNLRFIFSDACGDITNKVDVIRNATAGNRDNHSAIIVHILEVDGQEGGDCAPECEGAASEGIISPSVEPSSNVSSRKILFAALAILALIAASFAAGKLLF